MGLIHRFDLLRAYCSQERDFECSPGEFLKNLLRPTANFFASSRIVNVADAGNCRRISLQGIAKPLYWPRQISLHKLYMVIAESLNETDWHYYEVPETTVESGDVVLDCGAAEGIFSLNLIDRAKCILIEPSPVFTESLARTFAGVQNVQIISAALSSQSGKGYLSAGCLNSVLHNAEPDTPQDDSVIVRTTTIDELVVELGLDRVDYIKGDLESFELPVLRGGERTIRKFRPKMALTTYHKSNDWKEMRDFVLSLVPGYSWHVKGLSYLDKSPKPVMIHFWPTK